MNLYQILLLLLLIFISITVFVLILFFLKRSYFIKKIQNLSFTIKDFSEKVEKLNFKLNEQLQFLDLIFDNIPHGILLLDSQFKILKVNESLSSLFYFDRKNIVGLKTVAVFNNINLENLINKALKNGEHLKDNITFYGDEDLTIEVDVIPLNFEDLSAAVLFRNTTQEFEFSKLRSQFVANVSHEMRTPLTSVKGYIETLLEDDFKDKKTFINYLTKTLSEIQRLNYLIDDILDLSNIEYKRNILVKKDNNLIEIIKEIINSLASFAKESHIKIDFEYNKEPIFFLTDAELFGQLVRNMIENTLFHGGEGINLKIELQDEISSINLFFIDNGIGIDKQDLPFIFQRFYKGKNPFSKRKNSSGLGLSIVKHIVELHNGSISVVSVPNVETRFTLTFPKN